jgi:hypothetical protein
MGLAVKVGSLAFALSNDNDSEAAAHLRRDLQEINRVLTSNGLPPHHEPEHIPAILDREGLTWERGLNRGMWLSAMPYVWLAYLWRAIAFAKQAPNEFVSVVEGDNPAEDDRVVDELCRNESHIICHSPTEGYFVPVDFPEPLHDDTEKIPGGVLGSSQRCLAELRQVAPLLGISLEDGQLSDALARTINGEEEGAHPNWIERHCWLYLFERFRQSVKFKSMVEFA